MQQTQQILFARSHPRQLALRKNGTAIPRLENHVHLGRTVMPDLRWSEDFATVLKIGKSHLELT